MCIRDRQSSIRGKIGGLIAKPVFMRLRTKFNADTYGGAYLLGVRGLMIITHGNASGEAMRNAIVMGARGAREDLVSRVQSGLAGD